MQNAETGLENQPLGGYNIGEIRKGGVCSMIQSEIRRTDVDELIFGSDEQVIVSER